MPALRSRRRREIRVRLWRTRRAVAALPRRTARAIRRSTPFALGIVAALIAVSLYGASQPKQQQLTPADVNRSIASALASVTPPPAVSEAIYQDVAPSLVVVQVQEPAASSTLGAQPSAIPSTGTSAADVASGLGSGVIVDDAGDILTALHVVANATAIQVSFADGTKSPAQVTATDPAHDIAVLTADQPPQTIVPAVLGDPRSVQVGSPAFVLGNPFGLAGSMSSGIVSALDRSFQLPNGTTLTGLIQVDAAVNPGSSGGPLVDRDGRVVGIVTALINPTNEGVFIGIGLAVPIDVASGAVGQLPQY